MLLEVLKRPLMALEWGVCEPSRKTAVEKEPVVLFLPQVLGICPGSSALAPMQGREAKSSSFAGTSTGDKELSVAELNSRIGSGCKNSV